MTRGCGLKALFLRRTFCICTRVAQRIEQRITNLKVAGSNPAMRHEGPRTAVWRWGLHLLELPVALVLGGSGPVRGCGGFAGALRLHALPHVGANGNPDAFGFLIDGYLSDPAQACSRAPKCAGDYQQRIFVPLFDRIDLHVDVAAVTASDLTLPPPAEGNAEVAARVARARPSSANASRAFPSAPMPKRTANCWTPSPSPMRRAPGFWPKPPSA